MYNLTKFDLKRIEEDGNLNFLVGHHIPEDLAIKYMDSLDYHIVADLISDHRISEELIEMLLEKHPGDACLDRIFKHQQLSQSFIDKWFPVFVETNFPSDYNDVWRYQDVTERFIVKNAKHLDLRLDDSENILTCLVDPSESFILEMQLKGHFKDDS